MHVIRDLLHAANLRHHAENFFALKNPTASAGFEPMNLGTKGQHATPRPPKQLVIICVESFDPPVGVFVSHVC